MVMEGVLQIQRTHRLDMLLLDDVLQGLLPDVAIDAPSGEHMTLREDILDLLERAPCGFGEAEQDVDERGEVEGAEDEVRLVGDGGEAWWDGPGEGEVEEPAKQWFLVK